VLVVLACREFRQLVQRVEGDAPSLDEFGKLHGGQ
jgi:hypothetical protein